MDLTDPEFTLVWPREAFVTEAIAMIRADRSRQSFHADYALLLQEAFAGEAPATEYTARQGLANWTGEAATDAIPVVSELIRRADELRTPAARRPYFSRRNIHPPVDDRSKNEPDWSTAKTQFSALVARWQVAGYFGEEYPAGCVDVHDDYEDNLAQRVAELYGHEHPALTPARPDEWSNDELCDLIELLHDLAARPRNRFYHDFSQCGYHYSNHSLRTGQMLYRARVNELLDAAHLPYRLAVEGEDMGRLVTITDDARSDLLVRASEQPTPQLKNQVGHAIALYRSRESTREDKVSAIRELMAILEPDRYAVLKGTSAEKDNESLFQIANKYAIRHNKESELRDYSIAFLDWMFWATLAMVELCKELKATAGVPTDAR